MTLGSFLTVFFSAACYSFSMKIISKEIVKFSEVKQYRNITNIDYPAVCY